MMRSGWIFSHSHAAQAAAFALPIPDCTRYKFSWTSRSRIGPFAKTTVPGAKWASNGCSSSFIAATIAIFMDYLPHTSETGLLTSTFVPANCSEMYFWISGSW